MAVAILGGIAGLLIYTVWLFSTILDSIDITLARIEYLIKGMDK